MANDSDPNQDILTLSIASAPANGSAVVSNNNTPGDPLDDFIVYAPNAGFYGTDSFTYRIDDGNGGSATATVAISVNSPNQWPVVADQVFAVAENSSFDTLVGTVVATDPDAGQSLTFAILDGNTDGAFAMEGPTGHIRVANSAALDFESLSSFALTVAVSDNGSPSRTSLATVTINLTDVNEAPVAKDDWYSVSAVQATLVTADQGLLRNDTDPEDNLTVILVSAPANGTLTLEADGSFEFVPGPAFAGTDFFVYTASDGVSFSNEATVYLVNGPVARDDAYEVTHDQTLVVPAEFGVLTNDDLFGGTNPVLVVQTMPEQGTLALNNDGSFTFTPSPGFAGTDYFEYLIEVDENLSNVARVTLSIGNYGGVGVADFYEFDPVDPSGIYTVEASEGVLQNDVSYDEDVWEAQLEQGPQYGTVELNPDGSFTYTTAEGFSGEDTFSYRPFDGVAFGAPVPVELFIGQAAPRYTVRGQVTYDRTVGQEKPLRQALVAVIDARGNVLGTTFTDDQGNYTITLGQRPNQQFRIRVFTASRTPGNAAGEPRRRVIYVSNPVPPVQPIALDDNRNVFSLQSNLFQALGDVAVVNLGIGNAPPVGNEPSAERAFWTFDALVTGMKLHGSLNNVPVGTVYARRAIVRAPTSYTIRESPSIIATDWNDWDTIIHEYGHAVQQQMGFFPFALGQILINWIPGVGAVALAHSIEENTRITHPNRTREVNNQLAFSEGFANFYSMVAQAEDTGTPTGVRAVGAVGTSGDNKLYTFSVNRGLPNQTGAGVVGRSNGEDEELTVMRVLWDLHDPNNATDQTEDTGWDTIAHAFQGVIDKILDRGGSNQIAYTLSDMWRNVTAGQNPTTKLSYGAVFQLNNVSPVLDSMRINGVPSTIWRDDTDPIPEFVWIIPSGRPNTPLVAQLLNEFRIHFFNSDGSQELLAPITVPAPAGSNMVSWTPTQVQWDIITLVSEQKRWFVEGSLLTGTYRTGWYWSSEFTFDVLNNPGNPEGGVGPMSSGSGADGGGQMASATGIESLAWDGYSPRRSEHVHNQSRLEKDLSVTVSVQQGIANPISAAITVENRGQFDGPFSTEELLTSDPSDWEKFLNALVLGRLQHGLFDRSR
ncbi:MAG: Ig-like domain-containing protein [Planctomycetes bacterium]|nr:Ig-like domain-containing protein [Planctomycetota bacterium]